jgi:glutamine synthetase
MYASCPAHFTWSQDVAVAIDHLNWRVHLCERNELPGQLRTDFSCAVALTIADRVTVFRLTAENVAKRP